MGLSARHILVRGRVQGVAFRYATQLEAQRLGVHGWVRNRADGRVEAHLQGELALLDELLEWLQHGPPTARVDELAVTQAAVGAHHEFEVRATVPA